MQIQDYSGPALWHNDSPIAFYLLLVPTILLKGQHCVFSSQAIFRGTIVKGVNNYYLLITL